MDVPEVRQANPEFNRWGSVLSAAPNGPNDNAMGAESGGYTRFADGSLHQSSNGMDEATYQKNVMNLRPVNEDPE
jgi:hypothetical protein